jgi:hypothetical protein
MCKITGDFIVKNKVLPKYEVNTPIIIYTKEAPPIYISIPSKPHQFI